MEFGFEKLISLLPQSVFEESSGISAFGTDKPLCFNLSLAVR